MNITDEQAHGSVPVSIISVHGNLDASNYEALIERARALHAAGARHIVIDMSNVPFMASSGLVALHSIVLLLQGRTPPDLEHGWNALHDLEQDRDGGAQPYVKLLNPQPKVMRTLELTGLAQFFEIYTDRQAAIHSFAAQRA
jgi:anti-anti-sigma regulatory factor